MNFETKDSGERTEFSTGMQRDTSTEKPRFDLITPFDLPYPEQMLTRWASLMQRGAAKYNARNWEKASTKEELDRFMESAFRHFMQWFHGETDEDHAAAVFFNISGAEYVRFKIKAIHQQYPIPSCVCSDSHLSNLLGFPKGEYERIQQLIREGKVFKENK